MSRVKELKAETPEQAAIEIYKPPFKYSHGYIFDGEGNMFSDDGSVDEMENAIAARIRGWGRIGYIEEMNPADIQDAVGEHVAKALNEYWAKHATQTEPESPPPTPAESADQESAG